MKIKNKFKFFVHHFPIGVPFHLKHSTKGRFFSSGKILPVSKQSKFIKKYIRNPYKLRSFKLFK